jgi:beta propeller repeat protein
MKNQALRRLLAFATTGVMLLGSTPALATTPPLPAITFSATDVAVDASDWEWNATLGGKLLAWDCRIGPAHTDYAVYVRNLATGETRSIGVGDGFRQYNCDVSGDRVVYQDNSSGNWNIRLYSWATNSSVYVASTADNEVNPRIDGNLVVWKDLTTGYLWYRDYGQPMVVSTQLTAASTNATEYDVDNGRIIWSNPDFNDFRVAMVKPPLITGQLSSFGYQPTDIQVHGDHIVSSFFVSTNNNLTDYDFRSRTLASLASTSDDESQPTVFHNTFAWIAPGTGSDDVTYSRPGHLSTVVGSSEQEQRPSAYGHRVAWDRNNGTDWDVVLATATTKLQSRTYGANRYETAAAASRAYFGAGPLVYGELNNVVLCTGENFPDALSAAPFARAVQSPLLLTRRDSIPAETLAEISRLAPTKIYIIGGPTTTSAAVENQLTATYTTERIAGSDRYETSALIARRMEDIVNTGDLYRGFFARGDIFPDALALGPVAAAAQGPILLVKTDSVPTSIASAVTDLDIEYGCIAGDTSAVSASTASTLNTLIAANGAPGPCTRFAGVNRYDTARLIVNEAVLKRWVDLDTLGIATGTRFPDALAGGAALGYSGSPVMLTSGTSLSSAAGAFLDAHQYEIGRVEVFGGTDAVSDTVYNAIAAKIK